MLTQFTCKRGALILRHKSLLPGDTKWQDDLLKDVVT